MSQSDFVTRGQALVSSGQYQEAVKVCRLGLLGRPTTVEGRVVLGQALLALKRYDEVLAEMRVALELDHASVAAQLLKGEALLKKGDGHGALEVLTKLRSLGLADAQAAALLAEAERLVGRKPPGAPAGAPPIAERDFEAEHGTKNYPNHNDDGVEDTGGEYTRPTSLAAPSARRRSDPSVADRLHDRTPPPAVLAVGDRSGTVEVDPEVDRLESRPGDDDFGEVVGPPVARNGRNAPAPERATRPARGPVPAGKQQKRRSPMFKEESSTVELDEEEIVEVEEPRAERTRAGKPRKPGPGTQVRNAVKMPSGPIDLPPTPMPPARPQHSSTMPAQSPPPPAQHVPPHLAQLIANQPHVMNVQPQPSRSQIAAALPTAAAMPMPAHPPVQSLPMGGPPMQPALPMGGPPAPPMPMLPQHVPVAPPLQQTMLAAPPVQLPPHLQPSAAAARPTLALNPQQQQSAAAVDALFNGEGQPPNWARAQMLPVPAPQGDPGYAAGRGHAPPVDPAQLVAQQQLQQQQLQIPPLAAPGPYPAAPAAPRTGMRRSRSKLQIVIWVLIGALVIGGGVFAGFQIRAIRLKRQIAAARERAVDVARADTWQGWLNARDSLYSIAQASPTPDNKAALAHARALIAFEFGDGVDDARASVDALTGTSNDATLARAYFALAQSDARAAREAAERAAPGSEAAYVAGQAALLAGDLKAAITNLKAAAEKEPRPLYLNGLARALAAATQWDDALAALDGRGPLDKAGANPAALITRASLVAATGRPAGELRTQLTKLIADGQKPGDDHASPAQLAFANLALAQLELARDLGAAHAAFLASLQAKLDDQRFAEEFAETGYAIGDFEAARKAASRALKNWPTSQRARLTLAQAYLATGKAAAAAELFARPSDATAGPRGQTVRGQVRLATGDLEGARADFDGALKKLPGYEPAVIARTWLDLASGDVDGARQRIEPKLNPRTATLGMLAVYAAVLRATSDPAARDKARALLEPRLAGAPPTVDAARAQLELARIDRELGDFRGALAAAAEASRSGGAEARLETAGLMIENGDPKGAHDTLEQLVKDAGDAPSPALVLEAARARALTGDHAGAAALLEAADKLPGVVPWQVARERGRLALRRNDAAAAARHVERALADCAGDLDTFLLAADVVSVDDKQTALAGKLKQLMPARLKGRPELDVLAGKLELAAGKLDDAERAYVAARDALKKQNASPRRLAQADYGLAAVAYFKKDDPTALNKLALVMMEDPAIDAAYLFAAEIERAKDARTALDHARQAVAFNPDSIEGWRLVGGLAGELGDKALADTAAQKLAALTK